MCLWGCFWKGLAFESEDSSTSPLWVGLFHSFEGSDRTEDGVRASSLSSWAETTVFCPWYQLPPFSGLWIPGLTPVASFLNRLAWDWITPSDFLVPQLTDIRWWKFYLHNQMNQILQFQPSVSLTLPLPISLLILFLKRTLTTTEETLFLVKNSVGLPQLSVLCITPPGVGGKLQMLVPS